MTTEEIERVALSKKELPDGMNSVEQLLFLSLRQIYLTYEAHAIDNEQAGTEKNKVLNSYKDILSTLHSRDIYLLSLQRWDKAEKLMPEFEKDNTDNCPTCELAKQIIKILDGRIRS